jgi:Glycosyl hydrolase family 47
MKRALVLLALASCSAISSAADTPPTATPTFDRAAAAAEVRAEFLHAWEGYKRYAWGHDELIPVSRAAKDWYAESLWMTPIDALDTMLIMGLNDEAEKTKAALLQGLSFDKNIAVKNFEITIRVLGGLLSAYQMTQDRRLLALAEDLGNRLLPAFESPTGMPYMYVNLKTGEKSGARSNPAEIGTLILEFGILGRLTGKTVFFDKAKRALVSLYQRRSKIGLVGEEIHVESGTWTSPQSHIGGGIDSYYEYLVKCARLFGDSDCADMAQLSLRAVNRYLVDDRESGLWYGQVDMSTGRRTATIYGALQAFFPATLALFGDVGNARRLQDSGWKMWTLRGIEPEELDYRSMSVVTPGYALRPEIIESAYYLFHYTKDPKYLVMGRAFFDDIRKYCRTENGYTVLTNVVSKEKGDLMPSYFLAETLKYLYLMFKADALDFDKVVFNTEAHPLRRSPSP